MKTETFLNRLKPILVSGYEKATAILFATGKGICRWYGGLSDVGRGRVQGMIGACILLGSLSLLWPKTPPKPRAETMKAIEDTQARMAEIARQSQDAAHAPPRPSPSAVSLPAKTEFPPSVAISGQPLPPLADRFSNEVVSWDAPVTSTVRFLVDQPASQQDWNVDAFHVQDNLAVAGESVLYCGPGGWFYEQQLAIPGDDDSYTTRPGRLPVRIVGKRILVGDPSARRGSGVVHVFERTADGWKPTARLAASDAHPEGNFGCSIDGEGDFVVVGARSQATDPTGNSGNHGKGCVYLFHLKEQGWNEVARWHAGPNSQGFGFMVRMAGEHIAASGWVDSGPAILVGRIENQTIHPVAKLNQRTHGIAANPSFAFDGATLVCRGDGEISRPGPSRGAERALVFESAEGSWRQIAELIAPDYHELDNPVKGFGAACEVDQGLMLVNRITTGGKLSPYVFQRDGSGNWHPLKVAKGGDRPEGDAAPLLLKTLAGPDRFASLHMGNDRFDFHECRQGGAAKGPCPEIALKRIHPSCAEKEGDLLRQIGRKEPYTGEVYQYSLKTGVKIYQGSFEQGKKSGLHTTWFPTGRVNKEENFRKGLRHGKNFTYNEHGEWVIAFIYENDACVKNLDQGREDVSPNRGTIPLENILGPIPQIQIQPPDGVGSGEAYDPDQDDRMRKYRQQQNDRRGALGLPPVGAGGR